MVINLIGFVVIFVDYGNYITLSSEIIIYKTSLLIFG